MTGLKFLKHKLDTTENSTFKTHQELKSEIRKSTSRILVWLILFNVLELSIFIFFANLQPQKSDSEINQINFLSLTYIISYFILLLPVLHSLIYMILIVKNYNTSKIKDLMRNILLIKFWLKTFIYLNILITVTILYYGFYESIVNENILLNEENLNTIISTTTMIIILFCIIITIICILMFYFFFKLIFGRFQKKLNLNYAKLKDMI